MRRELLRMKCSRTFLLLPAANVPLPYRKVPWYLLLLQCAIDATNCQTLAEDGCSCQACKAGWNENNSTGACDPVR